MLVAEQPSFAAILNQRGTVIIRVGEESPQYFAGLESGSARSHRVPGVNEEWEYLRFALLVAVFLFIIKRVCGRREF